MNHQQIIDKLQRIGPTVCHICGEITVSYCDPCGKPACNDCASTSMAYGIETYACLDCRRSKEGSA